MTTVDEHCRALYEPWMPRPDLTHTCDMPVGHPGPHHCPGCDDDWGPEGRPKP